MENKLNLLETYFSFLMLIMLCCRKNASDQVLMLIIGLNLKLLVLDNVNVWGLFFSDGLLSR